MSFSLTPQASNPTIGVGNHIAKVIGVTETLSKAQNLQIKVDFEDEEGRKLSHYYNTIGYAKNTDGTYKLDSRGNKQITDEDSKEVQKILAKLMAHAGLDQSKACKVTDLIGAEVGIIVAMERIEEGSYEGKDLARVKTSFDPANPPVAKQTTEDAAF